MWVYSMKGSPDNSTCKAHYVAKGYSETHIIDYLKIFSPTTPMKSKRILMQLDVNYSLAVHQMDVKRAYLHAQIDCDIYVCQPKDHEVLNEKGKPMVLNLNK